MNLITILNDQKQLKKLKKEDNKKKLKNQRNQTKSNNQIDVNLQNIDLQNYTISQKIKEYNGLEIPPNNLQSNSTIYLSTSTQTYDIVIEEDKEEKEPQIPQSDYQKLEQSYKKLLRLEELKKLDKSCVEINQSDAIEEINAQEFEINRLMRELDQLPQIDYEQNLKQQERELKTLQNHYEELQKIHEELQKRNQMLQQNLNQKLGQKNQ
ncbi:unnamed protein product (macronuclear) [Paramecium tetraurelia]|uniref:Uncharacterized protein n=1 Tax=Paramecium tetraurelia TaxID=5888 RepID=A0CY23_PARTE|nr:uncharacterized protein GSPATT00011322001 [Paramecium tetraurelia]CAK75690.1 unnamed protein product [Paramecium tetraurelia]|eukprot:XP_001443087.1 hypothetical protein (macronuclear) [Paramecium tetraurelia strain d4-2]